MACFRFVLNCKVHCMCPAAYTFFESTHMWSDALAHVSPSQEPSISPCPCVNVYTLCLLAPAFEILIEIVNPGCLLPLLPLLQLPPGLVFLDVTSTTFGDEQLQQLSQHCRAIQQLRISNTVRMPGGFSLELAGIQNPRLHTELM